MTTPTQRMCDMAQLRLAKRLRRLSQILAETTRSFDELREISYAIDGCRRDVNFLLNRDQEVTDDHTRAIAAIRKLRLELRKDRLASKP